jgi:hypothetical protein
MSIMSWYLLGDHQAVRAFPGDRVQVAVGAHDSLHGLASNHIGVVRHKRTALFLSTATEKTLWHDATIIAVVNLEAEDSEVVVLRDCVHHDHGQRELALHVGEPLFG